MANLSIIGMRGVGKSNVSRRLGVLTKRPVLSTDVLLEYERGATIEDIVAERGWTGFRDLEYHVISKVAAVDGLVVDCGGGVVVDLDDEGVEVFSERKVSTLRASGPIIWLSGDIARLAAKDASRVSRGRPQLDAARSAEEIMQRRAPYYQRAADLVIEVEGRKRADIAAEIAERFALDIYPGDST